MSFQSEQEVLRVYDDWCHNFAPIDLLQTGENMDALVKHLATHFAGVVTVTNLIKSEQELRAVGALQLIPPPDAAKLQADAVEEQSRRFREAHFKALRENQVERKFDAEAKAKDATDKRAADLAEIEMTISRLINNYSCSTLRGAINYSETNRLRAMLKQVEVRRDGKRDPELTLRKVRELISQLPS